MVRVRLLGTPSIDGTDGEVRAVRGNKPWALLARLVLADGPIGRRELSAGLFPDAEDPLASLRWCLAVLRKALGSAELFTGDPVSVDLPPDVVVDVHEVLAGRIDQIGVGELLDGVEIVASPEFSTWLLVAREHIAAKAGSLLREATITALSRGQFERAVDLAERAARRAPWDEGTQVLLVKSLAMAGHTQAAEAQVVAVERHFRDQLGCEPSPALRSAARSSVAASPPGVSEATLAASLLDAGRAALAAGAVDAGLDCLRRAESHAESAGDSALLGQSQLALGTALIHSVRGFDDEGCVHLAQAYEQSVAAGDTHTAIASLQERGYADALVGRREQAAALLDQARFLADGHPHLLCGIEAVAAFNLSDWGRLDDGLAGYEIALDFARHSGDARREAWVLGLGGWALLTGGDPSGAQRWLSECLGVVRDLQWVAFEPLPVTALAEADLGAEPDEAAHSALERCFALSCQLQDPCWEGASGRALALHHAAVGDAHEAVRWITDARTRASRRPDTWVGMLEAILLTETRLRAAAGDESGARATAREAVALAARAQLDLQLERGMSLLTELG